MKLGYLDQKFINLLADSTADRIIERLKKQMLNKKGEAAQPEMVDTKEAAEILHISVGWMRKIKDHFPHVKSGEGCNGRILFVKAKLVDAYANYRKQQPIA